MQGHGHRASRFTQQVGNLRIAVPTFDRQKQDVRLLRVQPVHRLQQSFAQGLRAPVAIGCRIFQKPDVIIGMIPAPPFLFPIYLPRLVGACPKEISCRISNVVLAEPLIDQIQKQRLERILGLLLIAGDTVGPAIWERRFKTPPFVPV